MCKKQNNLVALVIVVVVGVGELYCGWFGCQKLKSLFCFLIFRRLLNRFQVLQKLERTGIRETTLKSMEDYLTNSKQRVRINERLSNELSVKFGVPQGNIIGTTLFMECILSSMVELILKSYLITQE